ncbi:MAG TPA: single-stranded DNA-binding protein [Thermomicrobiales bacterium]|nr:single-stranded DNA-binding protein [Thermomicrobiales bacterium]
MVRGLNKVQIIGNLGRDPEMRFTPSGTAVTNFTVAVNRNRRGPDGNMTEETEWFRVSAWEKLAETCDKYLRKGSQVYIEGRLQSRKYTDKDGIERTAVEIVANEMIMLGSRGDTPDYGGDERGAGMAPAGAAGRPNRRIAEREDESDLDDVPF